MKYYNLVLLLKKCFNLKIENKIKKNFKILNFSILKIYNLGKKKLKYNIKNNSFAFFIKILFRTKKIYNISNLRNNLNIEKNLVRFFIISLKNRIIKEKNQIDYLNDKYMKNYIDDYGKILKSKITKLKKKDQRKISKYIKISRFLSVINF
ncbi:30S ribosomal protein S6 [Candidatus Vidania fulgoroideae]|nr:30S ribosomal protein S6 [Candidatus Vidania fulgoroideae]WDR79204.1 30S ribosomal protein S6 [Candidatus Vidania fulgoroideae]